jgi:hypothetical protein
MSWYYVLSGERQGPVTKETVQELYNDNIIKDEDYVWQKGFENWVKIAEVTTFKKSDKSPPVKKPSMDIPEPITELKFSSKSDNEKIYYIKIGADRGTEETEYGPFSLDTLIKLYKENRISAKTFIFSNGQNNWSLISEFEDFEQTFDDLPPQINDEDKRAFKRKPFIARMFIQNNQNVFEGICRDVSVGGMQVLIDQFPGNVGESIDINVHPETSEHSFVASGKIVRLLEGGQGFSFRFHDLGDEAVSAINSYIKE